MDGTNRRIEPTAVSSIEYRMLQKEKELKKERTPKQPRKRTTKQ
jgi:hypothetical protein